MAIEADLLMAVAQQMLGRQSPDPASLARTARRLTAVLAEAWERGQGLDSALAPAFAPDWGAPAPLEPPAADRESSPLAEVQAALAAIGARNGELNAFVTVMAGEALEAARQAPPGPLHGMPIAVKDLYDVAGLPTRAGSRLGGGRPAARDAALVARLRAAGAVIVGKTATHEFAYGTTTDSPGQPPARNPLDPARTPGGSSGGSGAAVAAGMVPVALGTDTAGSVRIPAACCQVVGLMPTRGRVSREGIIPLSWSLDHPGWLARTVADATLVLGAAPPLPGGLAGVRVGVPVGWLAGPMDPAISKAFASTLDRTRQLGATVREVTLPPLSSLHFISRLITLAEAGAYHAPHWPDQAAEYGPDVRAKVELGQFIMARDYLLALRLRMAAIREVQAAMAELDLLVTPTMPILPPLVGQWSHTYPTGETEPVGEAMLRFTAPFNVTGQPAMALPMAAGSVQLVARPWQEAILLRAAAALEAAAG